MKSVQHEKGRIRRMKGLLAIPGVTDFILCRARLKDPAFPSPAGKWSVSNSSRNVFVLQVSPWPGCRADQHTADSEHSLI